MTDREHDAGELLAAAGIGRRRACTMSTAGNLPGRVGSIRGHHLPGLRQEPSIERVGYRVLKNELAGSGRCPSCGTGIPGRW